MSRSSSFTQAAAENAKRTSPVQIGECNSAKKEHSAADYLRSLYRDGRLTATELNKRLRTLNDLATGKLRPEFQAEKDDRKKR